VILLVARLLADQRHVGRGGLRDAATFVTAILCIRLTSSVCGPICPAVEAGAIEVPGTGCLVAFPKERRTSPSIWTNRNRRRPETRAVRAGASEPRRRGGRVIVSSPRQRDAVPGALNQGHPSGFHGPVRQWAACRSHPA
jgi:hypothetical protein